MTPQELLQSWIDSPDGKAAGFTRLVGTATVDITVTPTPPPTPPSVTMIGPSFPAKSLDDVNLNAKPNWTYLLQPGAIVPCKNKQTISVDGVTLKTNGTPLARIDCTGGANWKEQQLFFSGKDCRVSDLEITGHDGADFVSVNNATNLTLMNVHSKVSQTGGGMGLAITFGCNGLLIDGCSTDATGRYSVYLGSTTPNKNVTLHNCNFGMSRTKENPANISEHCFRAYTVSGLIIDGCTMDNAANANGKQAMKLMSGDGVTITGSTFRGSTRYGRDVNDPPANALKNVSISKSNFTDWFRVDPGANVSLSDSGVVAHGSGNVFDMHGDGHLTVKNVAATYPNGKWSLNPGKITNLGGCTFNGQPVT